MKPVLAIAPKGFPAVLFGSAVGSRLPRRSHSRGGAHFLWPHSLLPTADTCRLVVVFSVGLAQSKCRCVVLWKPPCFKLHAGSITRYDLVIYGMDELWSPLFPYCFLTPTDLHFSQWVLILDKFWDLSLFQLIFYFIFRLSISYGLK